MGECFIMRRGGSIYKLPALDDRYPQDVAVDVIDGQAASATFSTVLAEHGVPASYMYQWYFDGVAVDGAVDSCYSKNDILDAATHNVYCEVKHKAGTVRTRVATLSATKSDSPVLDNKYPADITCDVGGNATFEVKIVKHGTSAEYAYQWYVDDVAVENATGPSYTMSNLATGKHRVFCKITSTAGTTTSRVAFLNVDSLLLYNNYDTCDEVTGGWTTRKIMHDGETLEYDVCRSTVNSIDLTSFSKLCFEGTMQEFTDGHYPEIIGFCIWSDVWNNTLMNGVAAKYGSNGNFTLDVSGLTGKYYIGYYVHSHDYGSINMKKCYLKV